MSLGHTLIRGGWILTLDAHDNELHPGDLLIEDATIRAVATDIPTPAGAEVIDAAGMIVLPGLVDTHRHTWQSSLRHRGADWSLTDYLTQLLGTLGARYRPEDVTLTTCAGSVHNCYPMTAPW